MPPAKRDPPERPADRVRVGVAGWSYADWRGTFYPPDPGREFSELEFIARLFDCVEINVTFYREVAAATFERWARVVEAIEGFSFTAKTHRDLTHSTQLDGAHVRSLCARTRESLRPLVERGILGAVLVQFPWYFIDTPEHRERIERLRDGLGDLPIVVEVRDRSFFDTSKDGALRWLERLGVNVAVIDLPHSAHAPPWGSFNTGPIGYFRFHGRNTAAWFDPQAGRDQKYDYLYRQSELLEFLPAVEGVAARTLVTYVIMNNHFRGQAPANALQFLGYLGRAPRKPPHPVQHEFPFVAEPEGKP